MLPIDIYKTDQVQK